MKVAIVHDFLKEYGGAERVLEGLHEVWLEAPIYTAFVNYEGLGPHADRIRRWPIRTTWAQSIPFISQLYSPLRFLAPFFFRSLDLSDYDVIISSTNAYYAKGIILNRHSGKRSASRIPGGSWTSQDDRRQIHICYCHTPPRSLYGYPTAMDWKKNPVIRAYGTIINHFLRIYDFKAAQAVDYFVANSNEVKNRINKFYRRDAVVIYPPVELATSNWQLATSKKQEYYLYVGKLAYAKHVDLAIAAANRLKIPLKIVGKGGEEVRLRRIAHSTSSGQAGLIEFLGEVSDGQLHKLYAQSKALIFPAEDEDFGIVPVEAIAHGVPVIAHRSGGIVESIIDGKTGIFFDALTVESLTAAIRHFNDLDQQSMQEACINQAQKFSKERFQREIKTFVKNKAHSIQ